MKKEAYHIVQKQTTSIVTYNKWIPSSRTVGIARKYSTNTIDTSQKVTFICVIPWIDDIYEIPHRK